MRERNYRVKPWTIACTLPLLGLILGAVWGFCNFLQAGPQYKATAQLQVVTLTQTIPKPIINGLVECDTRYDEMVLVRSSRVLREAVDLRKLTQHPKFVGKSAEEIVHLLRDPRSRLLDVQMKSYADYSDVINISATTDDAKLSGDLVQAIVDGYEVCLKENRNPRDVSAHLDILLNQFEEAKMTAGPAYLETIISIELVIKDKIRRLSSDTEASPITRLEIPTIGSFAGPYLSNYVGKGALVGFLTSGALLLLLSLANASPKHWIVHN